MVTIDMLTRRSFWREVCGQLNIDEGAGDSGHSRIRADAGTVKREQQRLGIDGYFRFDEVVDKARIQPLRSGAERLVRAGIPAVFLSIYDEFWQMVSDFEVIGTELLGEQYRIFPDYWVWYLDPAREQAGWKPHREGYVDSDDRNYPTTSISLWLALSDATAENGCVYVLPKSKDQGYPSSVNLELDTLQHIRALEARAGSIIGWNQSVFHWGSQSAQWAEEPRVSFAMEFSPVSQRRDIPGMLDATGLPNFEQRLGLIAMQFEHYKHLHGEAEIYMDFSAANREERATSVA